MLSSSRTMAASSAFAKIVDGHHAEIRRYLQRVVPHRADADALCEETFVHAFRRAVGGLLQGVQRQQPQRGLDGGLGLPRRPLVR
jgi:hypothetical protein